MWKILGKDAMYVEFADVWKERMMEIAGDHGDAERFRRLVKDAEVAHLLNGSNAVHTFMVRLSDSASPDDIQFLADLILNVANNADFDFVSLDGEYQRCQVIFSNEDEPEILGLDKKEGYSAGAVFKPVVDGWSKPGRQNEGMM